MPGTGGQVPGQGQARPGCAIASHTGLRPFHGAIIAPAMLVVSAAPSVVQVVGLCRLRLCVVLYISQVVSMRPAPCGHEGNRLIGAQMRLWL
jgi:hypothetical protein